MESSLVMVYNIRISLHCIILLLIGTLVHGRVGSFHPFFLRSVYLDELLQQLTSLDIGSHVSHHFVMLMTLTSSALRTLQECGLFAIKQLIYCFHSLITPSYAAKLCFYFGPPDSNFSDPVTHLGALFT